MIFGMFKDPKAAAGQVVKTHISRISADIKEEEEHTSEVLDKMTEPLYIAVSPMTNVYIGRSKISALLDSGAEVSVITAELAWNLGLPTSQSFSVNMSAVTRKIR
jgi:hypothetical protein